MDIGVITSLATPNRIRYVADFGLTTCQVVNWKEDLWTAALADEVRDEARQRLEVFGRGGGFVFNSVHNIQANVPVPNVVALFDALRESR